MTLISLLMQLAPGLISVRILWSKKKIDRTDYKLITYDYLVYSFLIQLATYGFMFFSYPDRTVSFVVGIQATSHVLSASFVFKYSLMSLIAALVLPVFVPWLAKMSSILDDRKQDLRKQESGD